MAAYHRTMTKPVHLHLSDLRGVQRVANDAAVGLTDLVEALHQAILRKPRTPRTPGKSPGGRTSGITGLVYKSVRGITRVVGGGLDALLGLFEPLIADRSSSPEREAIGAALNGLFGDYLVETGNPLAIAMRLRKAGVPLAIDRTALAAAYPDATRRIVVLAHGLCMNDLHWTRNGHDHGVALARDLGYTPIYAHYNTGRHISTNGREFAGLIDALLREWPAPVERLVIIGHSMGGLVARSACHHAAGAGDAWLKQLDALVFLGTPHLGAPLERAGALVDHLLRISPYTAPFERLAKVRSAGIKDLRHGSLRDEDWQPNRGTLRQARAPVPLPDGVRCYAVAASKSAETGSGGRVRGDGLVPVSSALGRHRDPRLDLALPEAHRAVEYGIDHFDLLDSARVYERLREWLRQPAASNWRRSR